MTKLIINNENPNGILVETTAEEITQAETDKTNAETEQATELADKEATDTLKASAKAKLIAGEPLTEAEADTLVL